MATYKCKTCGKACDRTGVCPSCKKTCSKECPVCGESIESCTCRSDIPETKGHAPR